MAVKTILSATGNEKMDKAFSSIRGYEVVDIIMSKKDVEKTCDFYKPDILVVSDLLKGSQSLKEVLFNISSRNKNIRIIYLVGEVNSRDTEKYNALGYLVMLGVYDIITEKKFNLQVLEEILNKPKSLEDVKHYTKNISVSEAVTESIEFEEEVDPELDDGYNPYNKIVTFSSIKPGSGKTYVSVNVATAIAKYGKLKSNKERPRVALIEGDFQNLSIGTLLQVQDNKKNLKTALDKISTLFNDDGDLIAKASQMDEVNKFVKSCFKPYYYVKNLDVLAGSQISYEALKSVKPQYFVYLMEAILDDYDVVIVDSNSSVEHKTTEPIMYMSKTCYYILNLDFNNVRNNARYKSTLRNMQILDKVKYILNEDIEDNCAIAGTDIEPLEFTKEHLSEVGFDVIANLPMLPKSVFLNRIHDGKPVVLEEKEYTLKTKYEFFKICNQIWDIEGFSELERRVIGIDDNSSPSRKRKGLIW